MGVIIFCCFAVIGQLMGVYGLLRSNAYCVISCMALYVLLIVGPVVNVFKLGYPILVFTPWNGLLWIVIWPYSKEVAGELVERRKGRKRSRSGGSRMVTLSKPAVAMQSCTQIIIISNR